MRDYIFEGVAAGIIILAIGRLIIIRCCIIPCQRRLDLEEAQLSRRRQNLSDTMSPPPSRGGSVICLVSSFKYRNGEEGNKTQSDSDSDTECSICLSVFEEGEEMRKLPMCHHCFHAYCIDRWLLSHTDCPLCRAPVVDPPPPG